MHDDIRLGRADRGAHGLLVKTIGDDRFRAELSDQFGFRGGARQTDHGMTRRYEPWNKPASNGARGASDKDAHGHHPCVRCQPARRYVRFADPISRAEYLRFNGTISSFRAHQTQ
jgi:hypothetical protein